MKKTLNIQGMHCKACEILITKELEKQKVRVEKTSFRKGTITYDSSSTSSDTKVKKIIEGLGYKVLPEGVHVKKERISSEGRGILVASLFLFLLLLFLLEQSSLMTLIPSAGSSNVSLLLVVLIGFIASISTCFAVTGSLVLGISSSLAETPDFSKKKNVFFQILFQVGRIGGFFLFGGLLGWLGSLFTLSSTFTLVLNTLVVIILIYMGLYLRGVFQHFNILNFSLPKKRSDFLFTSKSKITIPLIGALTFFLPCGFTQAMQILAINTGSFWGGGILMAAFAFGTAPILFLVGIGSSYLNKANVYLKKIIGSLIVATAVMMGIGVYHLLPSSFLGSASSSVQTGDEEFIEITVEHNGWQIEEGVLTIKAGKSYRISIVPNRNGIGCMYTLRIPKLSNETHHVIKDQPIVYEIVDAQAGTYPIVCGSMGMSQGRIVVK